ncbi:MULTISPECIES: flagella biosynthesis regulatory protein FliT [Klebsiella]|jgi:flagellar protein FliT|uniref:flagella biosynthesis regulatory protein FliT n=1 Tax=Klebsiella TaxID=570 RepID=UPI0004A0E572|nr:flagella biosynthesis regulatory protein FliT [Klebsiella aerogenes]ATX87203.1 flagella biosynthesis regulatory protein FliT [Klebsiella aerogenes]EIV2479609.1 flagella biosynthesis regulatory protein FliT [Klebsiella aerogenes]EIV6852791.1 flagella biosynthesis regulatory protein FliT [Klebsiella aerogenes]EJL5443433.1 flagella biosynthesis regulatory protein FliT [Klebsiella aerogenes]EKU0353667.1 flagella biosynthesis regulatory protein FliT [Klebsiella aerogenes]
MERQQQLLAAYQQIHTLSSQMIALARAGQWEALVEMQFAYVTAVEKTAEFTGKAGPSLALQEMLNAKLQQIIDNEGVLKGLLQQRMEQLKTLIDQSTRQNAVNNAYGQFDDRSLLLGELQSDNVVAIKSKSEELQ